MENRLKELLDFTRDKWGLDNYYLHNHYFSRTLNVLKETIYTLTMEWFPTHITHQVDEDSNPDGTAVIDLNVKSRQFESVIFVGGKTYAGRSVIPSVAVNEIIKFIENETGLKFGNQFHLEREEEKEFFYRSSINGVPVSPSGFIDIKFDQEDKMTFFSLNGPFPSMDKVKEETFSLKLNDFEQIAKEQLKLIDFPSRKQNKWIPIYCIEEIYITNKRSKTLPYHNDDHVYKMDERIYWQTTNKKSFKRRQINLNENVTVDQVFSCQPHPDLIPISDSEKIKCIHTVKEFMSQVYSRDSGKWIVKTLHRENGYIFATLREFNQDNRMFQRKLMLIIESKTFKVINYMDNKPFLEMYEEFNEAESIKINIDQAYETIRSMIEIKPVYVYDFEQKKYTLCGKIDSDFGINGSDGEVVELNKL